MNGFQISNNLNIWYISWTVNLHNFYFEIYSPVQFYVNIFFKFLKYTYNVFKKNFFLYYLPLSDWISAISFELLNLYNFKVWLLP